MPPDAFFPTLRNNRLLAKRMADITIALIALPFVFPLMSAIALAVRLSSKGPVLLQQERIGRHGRPFILLKFRTMVWPAETGQPLLATPNDPRITPVGHILRRWHLDELPQLWLVLKGEMSVVGPRLERAYFLQQIVEQIPQYTLLFTLRPGLVSLGRVRQGYAHNMFQLLFGARRDLEYLKQIGLLQDVKIILAAARCILKGHLHSNY
ncbi:hypothetical protein BUE76_10080 [Cnuella takakiae]|nr:hypothetical protein BUE76_10080 [Cnuella takakiae]